MVLFSSLENLMLTFRDESRNDLSLLNLQEFIDWYHTIDTFDNGIAFVNAVESLLAQISLSEQKIDKKNIVGLVAVLYLPILQEPETSLIILPKLCQILTKFTSAERFEFVYFGILNT